MRNRSNVTCADYFFAQTAHLKTHLDTHTGEKPFKCHVTHVDYVLLERIFEESSEYSYSGEKPFKCENCGSRFARKDASASHLSSHTGEKPFKCDLCGVCFAHKVNLKRPYILRRNSSNVTHVGYDLHNSKE